MNSILIALRRSAIYRYLKVALFVFVAFAVSFTIYNSWFVKQPLVLVQSNATETGKLIVFEKASPQKYLEVVTPSGSAISNELKKPTSQEKPADNEAAKIKKITDEWLVAPSYQATLNRSALGLQNMAIVTFTSSNHLAESLYSCLSLSLVPELQKVPYHVFLADDIDSSAVSLYAQMCRRAKIKRFTEVFKGFPSYVFQYQNSYRFKSLIPAVLLKQYPIVMWADASIRFEPKSSDAFKTLIKHTLEKSNAVDMELYNGTGHMNHPVIYPKTYEFFPEIDPEKMKSVEQNQALFLLFFGTPNGWKHYSRLFKCALEKECMAPTGSLASGCSLRSIYDHPEVFSGCHRFDQSVLNMIAYIASGGNRTLYTMDTDAIHVIGDARWHE